MPGHNLISTGTSDDKDVYENGNNFDIVCMYVCMNGLIPLQLNLTLLLL